MSKRWRGVHCYTDPNNGDIHVWIYEKSEPHDLLVSLRIVGNKVHVEKGIVA